MRNTVLNGFLSSFVICSGDEIYSPNDIHSCFAARIMELATSKGKAKAVMCLSTCPKPSHPSTSANRSGVSASASMARNSAMQDIIDLTSVDESEDDDYTEVCCFKSLLHWISTGNVSLSLFL